MDRLKELLERQLELQRTISRSGADPRKHEGDRFADSVLTNVLALEDELHEFLGEIAWKPWADYRGRPRSPEQLRRAKMEIVDALHFFLNLCIVMRIGPDELYEMYLEKHAVNRERKRIGYDDARRQGL